MTREGGAHPPPSKIHENWKRMILDRKRLLPLSSKIQARTHPLLCFFSAEVPWFNQGAFWVVKPLKSIFCYLKGQGPLKNIKKFAENVEEYKAHRLIPLTPPLFFHFTLPLIKKLWKHHNKKMNKLRMQLSPAQALLITELNRSCYYMQSAKISNTLCTCAPFLL
jgi:hypothetical protein